MWWRPSPFHVLPSGRNRWEATTRREGLVPPLWYPIVGWSKQTTRIQVAPSGEMCTAPCMCLMPNCGIWRWSWIGLIRTQMKPNWRPRRCQALWPTWCPIVGWWKPWRVIKQLALMAQATRLKWHNSLALTPQWGELNPRKSCGSRGHRSPDHFDSPLAGEMPCTGWCWRRRSSPAAASRTLSRPWLPSLGPQQKQN